MFSIKKSKASSIILHGMSAKRHRANLCRGGNLLALTSPPPVLSPAAAVVVVAGGRTVATAAAGSPASCNTSLSRIHSDTTPAQ